MASFGSRLGDVLERRGLKQVDAARLIGVPQGTLSRYLNDQAIPSVEIARQIADRLCLSLDELTGEPAVNQIIMRETPTGSGAHLEAGFMADLQREWHRHPARRPDYEYCIRHLWPRPVAEKILTWLRTDLGQ